MAVRFAGSVPTLLKSVSDVIGKITDPKSRDSIASMVSPSTILNKSISSERSFAGVSISLTQAKALAKQAGGKLNDVVLAISSGVVRRYLLERGALPAKSMTAQPPTTNATPTAAQSVAARQRLVARSQTPSGQRKSLSTAANAVDTPATTALLPTAAFW